MKPKELILQRFAELLAEVPKLKTRSVDGKDKRVLNLREWKKWSLSAAHLIRAAMGGDSAHYSEFWHSVNIAPPDRRVGTARGVLEAAKEDFERGLNFNLESRLAGEIFSDFVGLAKTALEDGYKDVAAVLASAALEDTIKRLAKANGLENANDIEANINYLKSKGYFSGSVKRSWRLFLASATPHCTQIGRVFPTFKCEQPFLLLNHCFLNTFKTGLPG